MWSFLGAQALIQRHNQRKDTVGLLDPVSTVFKLSLLSYRQSGTKLSILENEIILQEPTILQGLQRWFQGDERNDLHKLYIPLKLFLIWYKDLPELDMVLWMVKQGIDKLQVTYRQHRILIHTLEHYKTKLTEPEVTSANEEIYAKLRSLWTTNEISLVCKMFQEIDEHNLPAITRAIECILEGKQNNLQELLHAIAQD